MFKIYTKDKISVVEIIIDTNGYFLLRELDNNVYEAFIYEENPKEREGYMIKEVRGECMLPFMKLRPIITPKISHYYFLDFPFLISTLYDNSFEFEDCY